MSIIAPKILDKAKKREYNIFKILRTEDGVSLALADGNFALLKGAFNLRRI